MYIVWCFTHIPSMWFARHTLQNCLFEWSRSQGLPTRMKKCSLGVLGEFKISINYVRGGVGRTASIFYKLGFKYLKQLTLTTFIPMHLNCSINENRGFKMSNGKCAHTKILIHSKCTWILSIRRLREKQDIRLLLHTTNKPSLQMKTDSGWSLCELL